MIKGFYILKYKKRLIKYSGDRNVIRSQDELSVLGFIANRPVAKDLLSKYLEKNWKNLFDSFGQKSRQLARFIDTLADTDAVDGKELKNIVNFIRSKGILGTVLRAYRDALDVFATNKRYRENVLKFLPGWLEMEKAKRTKEIPIVKPPPSKIPINLGRSGGSDVKIPERKNAEKNLFSWLNSKDFKDGEQEIDHNDFEEDDFDI